MVEIDILLYSCMWYANIDHCVRGAHNCVCGARNVIQCMWCTGGCGPRIYVCTVEINIESSNIGECWNQIRSLLIILRRRFLCSNSATI